METTVGPAGRLSAAEAVKYKLDGSNLIGSPLATPATREGQSGFELVPGSYTFEIQLEYLVETNVS